MPADPMLSPDDEAALAAWRSGDFDVVDDDLADAPDDADARRAAWVAEKAPRDVGPVDDEAIAGAADAIRQAREQAKADGGPSLLDLPEPDVDGLRRAFETKHLTTPAAPPAILGAGVVIGVDGGVGRDATVIVDAQTGEIVRPVGDDASSSQEASSPPAVTPAPSEQDDAGAATGPTPHRDDALEQALAPQLGLDLGIVHDRAPAVKLTDRFVVPPFSTLDSRATYWKDRKRAWLGLGIQSELGRDGTLTYQTDTVLDPDFYRKKEEAEARVGHKLTLDEFRRDHYRGLDAPPTSIQNTGTSIFDPVLCEVAYRWFSPPGGVVVDPFAGGSVRGVTASILGRRYYGVELRPEQVAANRRNAAEVVGPDSPFDFGGDTPPPAWVEGDATQLLTLRARHDLPPADLIFTCPPYADLEVYSDDPADLSTMRYPTFRAMLASAMAQSADVLRDHRFSVWVVGEARDPRTGCSYGIIRDTVNAATDAGLGLYNEAILETAIASAAMRATKQVLTSRKLVRVHQHVLIFVKGDGRKAADACGDPLIGGGR